MPTVPSGSLLFCLGDSNPSSADLESASALEAFSLITLGACPDSRSMGFWPTECDTPHVPPWDHQVLHRTPGSVQQPRPSPAPLILPVALAVYARTPGTATTYLSSGCYWPRLRMDSTTPIYSAALATPRATAWPPVFDPSPGAVGGQARLFPASPLFGIAGRYSLQGPWDLTTTLI